MSGGTTRSDGSVVPRLRGVSHQYAFFAFVPASLWLILVAQSPIARVSATLYGLGLCGTLGVSALYHRGPFSALARRRMRQLDHSMIFLFIAGTYTPFGVLALPADVGTLVLALVWGGGIVGVLTKLFWIDAPDWFSSGLYVVVGCAMVIAIP
ncbi:MAG: hemolysin III, partial [Myxococcota bacterium]